jgi:CRISPR-associated endonuclease Cas1
MQNPTMFQTLCSPTFLFEAWKTVKDKNASGGIDGISVTVFEDNLETYLREISESLKLGKWIPEPYLRIEIPKKDHEKRKLGLLSVKDKIVQQAIKMLVEPYFENEFVDNSYGYRPNKGHYKAVQRTWSECKKKRYHFFLKLDIDDYFDTINHDYLAALVRRIIPDRSRVVFDMTELYLQQKSLGKGDQTNRQNKDIIRQRKKEYRKRERENKELLVNTPGCFIGLTSKGVTVKQQGKIIYQQPVGALTHITIASKGITLSSNLIDYCLAHKITIDFFNSSGGHTGSILSNKYLESTLWNKQATCGMEKRNILAAAIILGKLRNQLALVKYFHKYHKRHYPYLDEKFKAFTEFFHSFQATLKSKCYDKEVLITYLTGNEAQGAIYYWNYIRSLLSDDHIGFEKRVRRGATDLVNMMLNYGYAILYNRVWQAILGAKLNPFDSIIHCRQAGKPTFVYDMVEIFRAQVVDRVVISLIQKSVPLRTEKGLLDAGTRKQVSQGVLERLNRYENYRGEELTLEDIIRRQMFEIACFIEKDVKYKPYTAKW